jgi:hypothetical protein
MYFGTDPNNPNGSTNGWPQFNFNVTTANGAPAYPSGLPGVKVPSGQTVLADSPFGSHPSSYNNNYNALTSNGSGPFQVTGGVSGTSTGTAAIAFAQGEITAHQAKLKTLAVGMVVGSSTTGYSVPGSPTVTKIVHQNPNDSSTPIIGVETSAPIPSTSPNFPSGVVYTFVTQPGDYAATAMANLWYTWANYYAMKSGAIKQHHQGSTDNTNKLTLTGLSAIPAGLVPGMAVTGNGISTDPKNGQTTILSITPDLAHDQVILNLSEIVTAASDDYQFAPPTMSAILGNTDPNVKPLSNFDPTQGTPAGVPIVLQFAQHVYQVMSFMSSIPLTGKNPPSIQLMNNVIGGNIGMVPNIGNVPAGNTAPPVKMSIEVPIRDMIKSLLRGVGDFTAQDGKQNNQANWYPNPASHTGNQNFNVYNLDPFVWFVHNQLGLSGYGFSLDDDVSDIGADWATSLAISIGGLNGLPNQMEYAAGAPYGVVSATATVDPGAGTLQVPGGTSTGTAAISFTQPTTQILFVGMYIGSATSGYSVPGNPTVTGVLYQNNDPSKPIIGVTTSAPIPTTASFPSGVTYTFLADQLQNITDIYQIPTPLPNAFWSVLPDAPDTGNVGAYVSGPGIVATTSPTHLLRYGDLNAHNFYLSQNLQNVSSGTYTYTFYGAGTPNTAPLVLSGTTSAPGPYTDTSTLDIPAGSVLSVTGTLNSYTQELQQLAYLMGVKNAPSIGTIVNGLLTAGLVNVVNGTLSGAGTITGPQVSATGASTGTAAIAFTQSEVQSNQAKLQNLAVGMVIGSSTSGYSVPGNPTVTQIIHQNPNDSSTPIVGVQTSAPIPSTSPNFPSGVVYTFVKPTTVDVNGPVSANPPYQQATTGGSLLPGSSTTPGTLSVTGDVTMYGASLGVVANGAGTAGTNYSQLASSGTVSLGNSTLNFSLLGGYTPRAGDTLTIVSAAKVTGTFSQGDRLTVNSGNVDYTFTITYNATSVVLTFASLRTRHPGRPGSLSQPGNVPAGGLLSPIRALVVGALGQPAGSTSIHLSLVPVAAPSGAVFAPGSVLQALPVNSVATSDHVASTLGGRDKLLAEGGDTGIFSDPFDVAWFGRED